MKALSCPLCGGAVTVALSAIDRNRHLSDATFTYHRCQRCGTLALLPTPADLGRYYPPEYYAIPESRDALLAAADPERYKLDIVRQFVSSGRLVEVGPAFGAFAVVMQDAGFDVSAIEMDATCCRFLEKELGIPAQQTSDPAVGLTATGPHDVIAMWHVIEHLPDPRGVLKAAARSLRPGGILVVGAPNPDSFQFGQLGARWVHLDAPRHLVLMSPDRLVETGRQYGLEPELVTTSDPGTLSWNLFGWRESLAGCARRRRARAALRLGGSVLARAMRPFERGEGRGSTYTVVLRRPA